MEGGDFSVSSVDSRIVTMKFENAEFERNASVSMGTIARLKDAMNFGGVGDTAAKGLGAISSAFGKFSGLNPFKSASAGVADLQSSTNKFTMAPMTGQVTSVSKSFVAMSAIAITAIAQVGQGMLGQVGNMGKNLVGLQAMADGWGDYGLKINATQTIMAGTGDSIGKVTKHLKDLDIYADETIYSLSDMVSNISKFTNAGVDLKTSVGALKGVAQVAALSGANTNEAARSMYNLGQAIGEGHVSLMNWRSVELANMGTIEFKQQLLDAAVAAGTLTTAGDGLYKTLDGVEVSTKNFGTTLSEKWLTSEALTATLGKYADKTTEIGKKATKAATEVKTFGMMMETLSAAAGTGWTDTYETLVGNLPQATKLWTGVTDVIGGALGRSADARNAMLKDWKELGGRKVLIDGLKFAFAALTQTLKPIGLAFRDIFPKQTAEGLFDMTLRFTEFMQSLKPSGDTVMALRRIFAGFFSVFDIAGQILGGVFSMIKRLFGAMSEGSGGVLEAAASFGDFLVAINEMLEKSGIVTAFFEGLGDILAIPLKLLAGIGGLFVGLFSGFDASGADKIGDAMSDISDKMNPLTQIAGKVKAIFTTIGETIGKAAAKIGDVIANMFTADTFSKSLDVINTGLLAAIVLMIRNFFSGGLKIDFGGGMFDSVKETLGSVTAAMQNMQTSIKADIIMKIAIALGILAAAIFVLATIDPRRLASALTGMAIGFAGLQIALVQLSNALGYIGLAKLPVIAAAIVGLATAMLIFALALKVMASINLKDMIKGLLGFGGLMFILVKAMKPLSANAKGMITAAGAILILGVAMNIMAVALKIFASMSWEEMGRGLAGLAGALIVLIGAMKLMPRNMISQAAALVALGLAMNALGTALKIFGSMNWDQIARGLTAMAGALTVIIIAMKLMPRGMLLQAAALNAIAVALNVMGLALKNMGGMSWEQIAKGLLTLAGSLGVLAAGLHLMNGTLSGAAALLIAAGALAVFTPVLITLGNLDWSTVLTALLTLAGLFTILGVAGYLLAPIVPVIIGLGGAMLLLGAGLALMGVGAAAMATAFAIVVATGTAGVQVMAEMVATFIASIPAAMAAFGQGIVEFAKAIAGGVPAFVDAFSAIIESILKAIIKNVPLMAKTFTTLILTALKVITTLAPRIFQAGIALILGFLRAIDKNISKIIDIAASIIVKFLDGIARNIDDIIQSGVNLIIKFIQGLTKAIRNNSEKLGQAGGDLAVAMIEGMANGIIAGADAIKDAAVNAVKDAFNAAKDWLLSKSPSKRYMYLGEDSAEGMAIGMRNNAGMVASESQGVAEGALMAMRAAMKGASDALSFEANMNPTIRPVLDLTALRSEAGAIDGLLGARPIMANTSFAQANGISADRQAVQDALASLNTEPVTQEIKFEQNNYSPKALSTGELYRNTRSQISMAKEALNV